MIKKLFYYILFPLRINAKLKVNRELKRRLNEAISKANKKAYEAKNTVYYVCQNAHEFFIGTKQQMRATQEAFKRVGVKWTWDKHIKYHTK